MQLQELRQNLGLSRGVVAMLSGVSTQRLTNFEQGSGTLSDAERDSIRAVLLQFVVKRTEQIEKLRAEIAAVAVAEGRL